MGCSASCAIVFGLLFEEGYQFPWIDDDDGSGDLEEWWREQNGYVPPFEPYAGN